MIQLQQLYTQQQYVSGEHFYLVQLQHADFYQVKQMNFMHTLKKKTISTGESNDYYENTSTYMSKMKSILS